MVEIVVTVNGVETAKMEIVNDGTGTMKQGNYWYRLETLPYKPLDISGEEKQGYIPNHDRKKSVWVLIRSVLNDAC